MQPKSTAASTTFAILFFTLLATTTAWSQPLTLTDLQTRAVQQRETVANSRLAVQQGELTEAVARSPFYPALDLRYSATALDPETPFENEAHSDLTGSLRYNLYAGHRDQYTLEAARHTTAARRHELDKTIQDLCLEVALSYLDVYTQARNLKVDADEVDLLKKRHSDAAFRSEVGVIRKNDVLKIKVELDNAVQNLARAQANLDKSLNRLRFFTGLSLAAAEIDFKALESLPDLAPYDVLEARLLSQRSDLKALQMIKQARLKEAEVDRAAYYPSVDAIASYSKYGDDYGFGLTNDNDDELRLTLAATLNLFDGYRKPNKVKRTELEVRRVDLDLANRKKRLATDLANRVLDFDVSQKNLMVADSGIDQAEENLRVFEAAFEAGVETATEVLDAIFLLSRAKFNYITARSDVFRNYYRALHLVEDFVVPEASPNPP